VKITSLGHAGLFIETHHGSILCDPWFNPAYFASWFPFPSNEDIDLEQIRYPDYTNSSQHAREGTHSAKFAYIAATSRIAEDLQMCIYLLT
jgi:hypothetical protein